MSDVDSSVNNSINSSAKKRLSRFIPWPRKLRDQMIVLVLITLLLAQGISLWILSNAHNKAIEGHSQRFMVRQLASIVHVLESTPSHLHSEILRSWQRPGLRFQQLSAPTLKTSDQLINQQLADELRRWLGADFQGQIRVNVSQIDGHNSKRPFSDQRFNENRHRPHRPRVRLQELAVAIELSDGDWLQANAVSPLISPLAARQTLIFLLVSGVLVLTVVIWRLRKITHSLSALTQAASNLGRGQKITPLQEAGPEDVKTAIAAFNHMSGRLDRFVLERTQMLAALSHDLRTPITSMRLRVEMMEPGNDRDKLLANLEEMQQMSEATLGFIRESGDTEPSRQVDIIALVSSLCDDLTDLGATIALEGDAINKHTELTCRPVSIKRALRNLIENAVNYGDAARVSLIDSPPAPLIIRIQDQGPGIPEAELERVFDPFYRLETSRNRETGGMGLGLSISRQVIINHGGDLRLQNTGEGLLVEVELPRQ